MDNIIFSPGKYIQGPNSLSNIGKYAKKNAFIIADSFVMSITKDIIEESFKKENLNSMFEIFNGECSKVEIDRLKESLKEKKVELIIGVGGGKTLDTAKDLAYYCKLPVVVVPTIASTDAPCSALSVL
ncbi:iron-containing alcohol dehydrogenase, partial [Cetobacterium sp.]|uniref:iron-containing alcohol dehydrogenase n=1 Tax=Cetobacterium sp. TaxID=2071632 RepID=UPI003F2FA0E0